MAANSQVQGRENAVWRGWARGTALGLYSCHSARVTLATREDKVTGNLGMVAQDVPAEKEEIKVVCMCEYVCRSCTSPRV